MRVPPFPHHKYMIREVSRFFRMPNLFNLFTMDKFLTVQQLAVGRKHDCFIPRCLLLDPTSSCNLNCIGCWAAGYRQNDNLSYEKLDDILKQAEALKIRYCFISGGEPLVRKDDLLELCARHRKMTFSAFTNGTLIDGEFADRMAAAGNLTVSLSLEGFRRETDFRRGSGVYDKVMKAMDILKERDIWFAFSCCYHSKNYKTVASDEFLDLMQWKGCRMGWLFTYIPVGRNADMELVCNAGQRAYVQERITEYCERNKIAIIDFWNNGHLAAGCVGASTGFVHINSKGDVEPCAFSHYSDSNIYDVSLVEALRSPFFTAYRAAQPFSGNPLRSCPLIDVPDAIEDIVEKTGAHSTESASPESVKEFAAKTKPIAEQWAPVADELFSRLPVKFRKSIKRNMLILNYKKKHSK